MSERKSISKKLRFEVFKRDNFICQYCGNKPPNVMLEIDHIKPVSKGGSNNINNLITSCFNCNRGKSNIELERLPNTLNENYEILKEKEEQLKQYHKLIAKIEKRIDSDIEKVNQRYMEYFPDRELSDTFKRVSVKKFVTTLPIFEVLDSLDNAVVKMRNKTRGEILTYFCGICWNKIKGEKPRWER